MVPAHPNQRGKSQSRADFFQAVDKSNANDPEVREIVQKNVDMARKVTGRNSQNFEHSGAKDAQHFVVVGADFPVTEESVDYLLKNGEKVGVIGPPAPAVEREALPCCAPEDGREDRCLDQTKEAGSFEEPFFLNVATSLLDAQVPVVCVGGRWGLDFKGFTPAMAKAVFDNLLQKPVKPVTVVIDDDVTHLSLPIGEDFSPIPNGTTQCMFWGHGSDWKVGANHDTIQIIDRTWTCTLRLLLIQHHTSGGVTVSHLRFGKQPSKTQHLTLNADFTACHIPNSVKKHKPLEAAKPSRCLS